MAQRQSPTFLSAFPPYSPRSSLKKAIFTSSDRWQKIKGETAITQEGGKTGKIFQKQERSRASHGFQCKQQCKKPGSSREDMGGTPAWASKTVQCVCTWSSRGRRMEQKVRKPVLSLLSSTLPPPREEAEETGGGAGCYRSIGGTQAGPWGAFSCSPPVRRSPEGRGNPSMLPTSVQKKKKKSKGGMMKSRWRAPQSAPRSLILVSERVGWGNRDGGSEGRPGDRPHAPTWREGRRARLPAVPLSPRTSP